MRDSIRIAVPKGRLMPAILDLCRSAGLPVIDGDVADSRKLVHRVGDASGGPAVEWVFVKDADVTTWVNHGGADAGFVGLDRILEDRPNVYQPLELPFGTCRMMLIGAADAPPLTRGFSGRVASKYPAFSKSWLLGRAPGAEIVELAGSVELAAALGLAPYIIDLVETGETIRAHSLRPLEEIAKIAPRLIVNKSAYRILNGTVRDMIDRLREASRSSMDSRVTDQTSRS